MDKHDATEVAYKNGYARGFAEASKKIFEEIVRLGHVRSVTGGLEIPLADFAAMYEKYTEADEDEG